MAVVVDPEDVHPGRHGRGWSETVLADRRVIGAPAMVARLWTIEPEARGPQLEHVNSDELLYVVSGQGSLVAGERRVPLGPETVVWLEAGDVVYLEAGTIGLEVLHGTAPAGT